MSFAIVDAAAGTEVSTYGYTARSRYTTSIANLPLIYHVFDELAAAGSDRVVVVVSPGDREELERVLGGGRAWGVEVSFRTAEGSDGLAAVLTELERVVPNEPVLVYPGDCLFPGQLSAMWERFRAGDVDAVVLDSGNASSGPAIVGRARVPVLADLPSTAADRRDLAHWLRTGDGRIAVCELGGHWCYSDETDDLLTANRMMLDSLPVPDVDGSFGDNNVVRGRVAISSSAHLSGSILHGPVAVDEDAVIEDSFVGPYSAIGAGVILRGAEIDNTMVLAGAEISHPGQRIEASIIGERAAVVRSFALPRGLHLRLEPHSRVIVS